MTVNQVNNEICVTKRLMNDQKTYVVQLTLVVMLMKGITGFAKQHQMN